jgi:hypothetical protein
MNGIKSLAEQGRYGDTMLAHINPEEAGILKALGGSGTINPRTGLPEYFNPFKAVKKTLSAFDDAILQPITGGIQDVVQEVAKATGPVGQIAATYFGGPVGAALYGGLAGEDGFNFKRGLMSGALAYGASNLAGGVEAAGGGAPPVPDPTAQIASELGKNVATGAGSQAAMLADQAAGFGNAGISNIASSASYVNPPVSFMDQIGSGLNKAISADTYKDIGSNLATKTAEIPGRLSNLGSGVSKLASGNPEAIANFKSVASLQNTALPMYMGATGVAAIDEAEKIKKQQEQELAEYNARVNRGVASATDAMRSNPYDFAAGGDVNSGTDNTADSGLGNLRAGLHLAKGGMPPRFLSGGGDGMSDSIKATINGNQPARLADGEFVIPADVVSHLGNGSSKAGAKQLYSMMDKVRSARTGTKKQGRQINPNKFLPA